MLSLGLFMFICFSACKKAGAPTAASNGKDIEVSGTVKEEDPTEFTQADESVQIGGVNVVASDGYSVTAFALSENGSERLIFSGVFATRDFSFKTSVPKKYLRLKIVRLRDNGLFGAVLPPPTSSTVAKLLIDRTTSIAAKMSEIILEKARAGDQTAVSALASQAISIADVLMVAQSVRRAVDQQLVENVAVGSIDLSLLAVNLVQKSKEKFDALAAEGVVAADAAKKISQSTYNTVFGERGASTPAGVSAYRANPELGASAAAVKEVAYEAIKAAAVETINTVNAAFRTEADAYRTVSTIDDAVAAQQQVQTTYAQVYRRCTVEAPNNCISSTYTPPPPPSTTLPPAPPPVVPNPDSTSPTAGAFGASTGVSITGFTLNWAAGTDGVTAQGSLQYYLCSGASVAAIDTVAECEGVSATKEMDWTTNVLTRIISGKSAGTTYYFNVIVRDAAGNKSVYSGISQATNSDTTPPTAGSFGASTGVSITGFTLNWTAGADVVTTQSILQYYLCSGASVAAIDTVAECEGVSATKEMDWTTNVLTRIISGKSAGTTYYFNVIVRDAAGNKSVYSGISQATNSDTTPPTAGSFGASTGVSSTGFTLNWTAGTDGVTAQGSLQYYLCSGASAAAIDTVAECESGGVTKEMDWTTNVLTKVITGKSASTTYYYNLMVRDTAGNKTIYAGKSETTLASGGGGITYTFFIPYTYGFEQRVMKYAVGSVDALSMGVISTSSNLVTIDEKKPELLSISMAANGTPYVVYFAQNASATNKKIALRTVNPSDLTFGTAETVDSGVDYVPVSADIALNGASPVVAYSVATRTGSGSNTIFAYPAGGTTSSLASTTSQVNPSRDVLLRFNSAGDKEVAHRYWYYESSPVSDSRFVARLWTENSFSFLGATGANSASLRDCGAAVSVAAMGFMPVSRADDSAFATQCSGSDQINTSNNFNRYSPMYPWSGARSYEGAIAVDGAGSTSYPIALTETLGSTGVDAYWGSQNQLRYCLGSMLTSACANGPGDVWVGESTVQIRHVVVATTPDGTNFLFFTTFDSVNGNYAIQVVKKTGAATWSTPYTLMTDTTEKSLGRRIGVQGVADNSNWATKHTMFLTSGLHNGNMEDLPYTTPDTLCQGYALTSRLPRALSSKAVIATSTETMSQHVGALIGDVYNNAATPSLIKSQADFFTTSSDPGAVSLYDQDKNVISIGKSIWAGGTANALSPFQCANWTNDTDSETGAYLELGSGAASGKWLNPSIQSSSMCDAMAVGYRLACITK
jgi:hypothetical protein